jgi:ATP-dependent DNA helicase RecG
LVNAIIHRDYTRSGAIMIDEYADRLIFRNPGQLPEGWSVGDLKRKHLSNPFNPNMARVFLVRGYMEMLGMGTLRMLDECLKIGAKEPKWQVEQGEVRLTVFAAPPPRPSELSPGHVRIMKVLVPGKALSIGQLARNAEKLIRRLGSGRNTAYERVRKDVPGR